jgi:5-methylcytosine-specific restriction endonuclease McrA
MGNVLHRQVLVLNRVWQAIDVKPVHEALSMMAAGASTGLDIREDTMIPVTWDNWLTLPILREDEVIHTSKLAVRMPTVIVACNYSKIPKRRPKFTLRNIARTYGNRCAYTDRVLRPEEWSKDHVVPLSRGGKDVPENVVLAARDVNNRKGDKLPHEAGLRAPKIRKLTTQPIEPSHPDHEHFIIS